MNPDRYLTTNTCWTAWSGTVYPKSATGSTWPTKGEMWVFTKIITVCPHAALVVHRVHARLHISVFLSVRREYGCNYYRRSKPYCNIGFQYLRRTLPQHGTAPKWSEGRWKQPCWMEIHKITTLTEGSHVTRLMTITGKGSLSSLVSPTSSTPSRCCCGIETWGECFPKAGVSHGRRAESLISLGRLCLLPFRFSSFMQQLPPFSIIWLFLDSVDLGSSWNG